MRSIRLHALLIAAAALLVPAAQATAIKRPPVTIFRGDGNYTKASRKPSSIRYVVIHVTEGRFWGSVGWLQNDHAEASANYVVSRAGKIVQLVHLSDIAWHSGNAAMNRMSVGIEHTGVTDDPAGFTPREYRASAELAAWLCRRSLIPIDRQHIIGHSEVPGADHTDPGRYWNWALYLKLVRQYAYPKPFKKLYVRSAPIHAGQIVAGNVPWHAETRGPKAARVDFLIDGKLKWSDHRAPFVFAAGRPVRTLALRNGRHRFQVIAYGTSGHSAASTLELRVLNRKLELTTAGVRRHQKVTGVVRLQAATTVPTPALKVYFDGHLVQQVEKRPYAVKLDVRKTVNGLHTIDLKTTDFLGRKAERRIPIVVSNPPPPPVYTPAQIVGQTVANGQTLQGAVAWTVATKGSVATVEFLVDGVVRATVASAPTTWTWDTQPESPGQHTLVARVTGRDGKVVAAAPVVVTVAAPPPPAAVTETTPPTGA